MKTQLIQYNHGGIGVFMFFSKRMIEAREERELNQNRNQFSTGSNAQRQNQISSGIDGYSMMGSLRQQESNFERIVLSENKTRQEEREREAQAAEQAFQEAKGRIIYGLSRSNDPIGFLSGLRTSIAPYTAAQAAEIVQALNLSVNRSIRSLDEIAVDSDGHQATLKDKSVKFDKAVANLSGIMNKINGSPLGSQLSASFSQTVANLIRRRNDIGRWDEALGNTLVNGDHAMMNAVKNGNDVEPGLLGKGSSILATQVVQLLQQGESNCIVSSKDLDFADDILQNINEGAKLLAQASEKLTERTATDQSYLNVNISNWGEMATPEQLNNAIIAAKDSYGTFAQLEAMGGNTLAIFNELNQLSNALGNTGRKKDLDDHILRYRGHFDQVLEMTESAKVETQNLLEDWEDSLPYEQSRSLIGSIIEEGSSIGGQISKGTKAFNTIVNIYLTSELNYILNSASLGQSGSLRGNMAQLCYKAEKLGVDSKKLEELKASFDKVVSDGSKEALSDFDSKIEGIDAFAQGSRIGMALRVSSVLISGFNLAKTVTEFDKRDLSSYMEMASSSVGLGTAGLALFNSNKAWVESVEKVLGQVGKSLGFIGLVVDGVGIIQDLKEGDYTSAALGGMGLVGGILAFTSFSGVGFAITMAAVAIGLQIQRIKLSNVLESEHTEVFLQELGITPEVAYHMRNASAEGLSAGRVLTTLMNSAQISPQSFVAYLNALSPQKASMLAEACHTVLPNGDGEVPLTDINAEYAGMSAQEFWEFGVDEVVSRPVEERSGFFNDQVFDPMFLDPYLKPNSIEGLINFIHRKGIQLPV